MEYIVILGICVIAILILKFAFQIKINDIKNIKEIGYNKKLKEIVDVLPDNKEVCEEILKKLGNEKVGVKLSEDKENKVSYYAVVTNNIIIADIKDTFTRIQTIAHECIHSTQNKKMLLFNFIFSNIYLLYFALNIILIIFKVIKVQLIPLVVLIIFGIIYYSVRSYLETDAMTKAPYLAREYMIESNKLSLEDIKIVIDNYNEMNKIGIPLTNFQLIMSVFVKIIIYCIIVIVI